MKKDISFICPRFYPDKGGVEKHVLFLSKALVKKGFDVTVYTITKDKNLVNYDFFEKIKIVRIHAVSDGIFNRVLVNLKFLFLISKLKKSSIIHFHDYFSLWGWNLLNSVILKFLFRKKLYITFHGWEGIFPPRKSVIFKRRLIEKLTESSMSIGHFISKWYGTNSEVISYGACETSFPVSVDNSDFSLNKILFIGRLEVDTGLLQYLDSIESVQDMVLDIDICGDGSLLDNVIEISKKSIHKINILGFIENIDEKIRESDVVFTSGYLGMLESFSQRKPVIATYDNPLKKDYLELMPNHSEMFFILDHFNTLSQIIEKIKSNDVRTKMIDNAYEFSLKSDWNNMVKNYEELWKI